MKNYPAYALVLATTLVFSSCSDKLFRQAEKQYTNYRFSAASKLYETYLAEHPENNLAMIHLADCYRLMNQHKPAEKWYEKSATAAGATPEDKLHYAQVLKENGKYREAQQWFDAYLFVVPGNKAALNQRMSCDSVLFFTKPDPFYTVTLFKTNVAGSVFSPVLSGDRLLVAAEAPVKPGEQPQTWTGHGFLDLYTAQVSDPGTLTPLAGSVNTNLHEGPAVFSPDGNKLYFTRSYMIEKKAAQAGDNDNHLELCVAEKTAEGNWTNVQSLPFNSKEYSCGHPAVSGDGKRLYFISDMPGGYGETDIYYSELVNGQWQSPVNLGAQVNTDGQEMFPVVRLAADNKENLYFSSTGWTGAGGLDLFYCIPENSTAAKRRRMPYPFNSTADDFGITFSADGKTGYFSSNRENEDGHDEIYRFERREPRFFAELRVKEKGKTTLLPNTKTQISNNKTGTATTMTTDANGLLCFESDSATSYIFAAEKEGYFKGFAALTTSGFRDRFMDTVRAVIEMEAIVINKPIRLENIYYDYNKWNIRADAAIELDKLVKIMNDNPQIKIELSSHTDCRGGDSFNQKLSQKRAVSAVDYIISKGVAKDRITAKGYGEKQLLNKCDDGVKCTEEEHQWNRRTEFKVTQIISIPSPL